MRAALALLLLLPAAALAQTGTLRPGVVRAGTLRSGGQDAWTFDARAGEAVSATLTSSMFDTVLELYGPSGGMIASNDDGGDGTNSALARVRLPRTGRYRFVARSYSDGQGGAYAIRMTLGTSGPYYEAPPPPPPPPPMYDDGRQDARPRSAGPVEIGQSSRAYIDVGTAAVWTFVGRTGQTVSLSLTSPDGAINAYLELLSPGGSVLASDDDGGDGTDSAIDAFRLRETAIYRVRGRDFGNDSAGPIILSVSSEDGGRDDGERGSGRRDEGEFGSARAGERRSVPFEGRRGEVVTITLDSSDFDPEVSLRGPSRAELQRNDDYDGLSSRIDRFRLPETGTYEVLVQGHRDDGAGRYVLRILR